MDEVGAPICGWVFMIAILWAIVSSIMNGYRKSAYEEQERLFEAWAKERFPLSEVETVNRLRKGNSFETVKGSKWAEVLIESDRRSRWHAITPFEKWGKEKFDDSWPETRDRLCRLVSANRTPAIDKLSDSEIETLNSYLLAETLGAANPGGTAAVTPEETANGVRWTQQKCQNCGASLLKGQCIYCKTSYTPA